MPATIKIKNSSTAGAAPTSGDLVQGELAVNVTDKRLYTENSGGTIVELGTNPSIPVTFPDGSASAPSLTNVGDTNTGMFFPAADTIAFAEGGTETMRLDSAGNMGLGVTPSAWASGYKAFQIGARGSVYYSDGYFGYTNNAYWNGSSNIYIQTGVASDYYTQGGSHVWRTAASGTAGNAISFTQAMTLDASGKLLVGATSSIGSCNAQFTDSNGQAALFNSSSASGAYVGWYNSGSARGFIGSAAQLIGAASANNFAVRAEGDLLFATSSFERARIDSSGNLLVGGTSPNESFSGVPSIQGVTNCIFTNRRSSTSASSQFRFYNPNGVVGQIETSGSSTTYSTSSDYRLKENIAPMTGALSVVAALKPCTYNWKVDGSTGQGFIAHELQEVVPDCVTGEKDAVDEEGNPKYQGIDTSFLVATLTAALQEQQALITSLTARIETLEQA